MGAVGNAKRFPSDCGKRCRYLCNCSQPIPKRLSRPEFPAFSAIAAASIGHALQPKSDPPKRQENHFFKALALGADAVCIGRPYLWGLASFGQAGVEAVLDLLRAELELVMKQAGTTSIDQIEPSYLAEKS